MWKRTVRWKERQGALGTAWTKVLKGEKFRARMMDEQGRRKAQSVKGGWCWGAKNENIKEGERKADMDPEPMSWAEKVPSALLLC